MLRTTRRLAVSVGAVCLLGLAPAAAWAGHAAKPSNGQGKVDPDRVQQGQCTRFSGGGFTANADLTITDDGRLVTHTQAGDKGRFQVRVCFATDARIGRHELQASGKADTGGPRDVTASVQVTAGSGGSGGGGYPPPTHGRGAVDHSSVHPGDCVHFSGGGFDARAVLSITDDGRQAARDRADKSGDFVVKVCFSSDARIGNHELKASGQGGNGGARDVTAYVRVEGVSQSQGGAAGKNRSGASRGSGARTTAVVHTLPVSNTEIVEVVLGALIAIYLGIRLTRWRNHRLWS